MASTEMLTGVVVVLTALVIYFHIKKFTYWSSRNIKGPTPWPIFGTSIYYLLDHKLKVDERWNKKYGKVYGLYEGYSPQLRVNDRELVNHIYVKQFKSFTDRDSKFIYNDIIRNWMLWLPGKQWSARRALVSPLFTSSRMRAMVGKMSDSVNRLLREADRRLLESGATQTAKSKPVTNGSKVVRGVKMDKTDISSMTLDVIGTNFFSLQLDTYRDKSNEFLQRAYGFAKLELGRFIAWILTPRQIAKAFTFDLVPFAKIEYFDLLTKKLLKERRQPDATRRVDFVQAFIDARLEQTTESTADEDEGNTLISDQTVDQQRDEIKELNTKPLTSLSDIEIRGQMSFLFVAGFETTSTSINFCLFELGHQQQIQEQLYEELKRVFKNDLDEITSKNKQFPAERYSDLMSLTLLDAFISETLRLYSPIIDNTRLCTEPVVLPTEPKLSLPAGVPISTNFYMIQHDADYWTEPEKFNVARFLPENRDNILPGSYLPFGIGSRHCLGMRFALLEIKLSLAKIILNHRIVPVSNEYPPKFQRNVIFLLLEKNDFELVPRAS